MGRTVEETIVAQFRVRIRVVKEESFEKKDCWVLEYTSPSAPTWSDLEKATDRIEVWVDKKDGMAWKVLKNGMAPRLAALDVESLSPLHLYRGEMRSLPLLFLPTRAADIEAIRRATSIPAIDTDFDEKTKQYGVTLRYIWPMSDPPEVTFCVRQKWEEGAKWWKEYEEDRYGHPCLRAVLLQATESK